MSESIQSIPFYSINEVIVNHEPKIKDQDLNRLINSWIQKQRHWPQGLKAVHLSNSLKLWYITQSTISGSGSAQWSAQIGSKATTEESINWHREHRYLYTHVTKETVFKSRPHTSGQTSQEEIALSELERDWLFARQERLSSNLDSSRVATEFARKTIQLELKKKAEQIASQLGDEVRDLRLDNFKTTQMEVRRRLYPIYQGTYSYGSEKINIQIDALTGELYITPPKDLKTRKEIEMSLLTLVMIGVGMALTFFMFAWF